MGDGPIAFQFAELRFTGLMQRWLLRPAVQLHDIVAAFDAAKPENLPTTAARLAESRAN
jgi:hypothetical protein